jgi:glyoxylase-like metal-dependent hydrolase (beta-lactamase superfamily II)
MPALQKVYSSRNQRTPEYVADGVSYFTVAGFVNVFFIGSPGSPWFLVDTGLPRTAARTMQVAAELFGTEPEAIILTHGHFDHAGAVDELSRAWRVPIYAHPLEMPYLRGRSDYPPKDSSMGGAIAHLARLLPVSGINLGRRVRPLPADGTIPGLDGWRWIHTPGHTAGHISLMRDEDRVLIAGDAVATMDLDSWTAIAAEHAEIARPAAPFTTDWQAAQQSVRAIFDLKPSVIAAGHGVPVYGPGIEPALRSLTVNFPLPKRGRYRTAPAVTDATGIVDVPPPVTDPYPAIMLGAAIGAFGGAMLLRRRRSFIERMFL